MADCRELGIDTDVNVIIGNVGETKQDIEEKFGEEIEKLKLRSNMNYIDCIVQYCEENSIELESVKKILPKALKEKLEYDARELNYLKKTTRGKLPL